MSTVSRTVQAYDDCAPGYREWRWNSLWDDVEVPAVVDHLRAAGSVVDLGCGYGRYAGACAERSVRYCGVDASAGMLGLAAGRRGSFVHADLAQYRSSVPADVVLSTRVLSNLEAPDSLMEAVDRNLRPGGTFVITDFHERYQFRRQTIKGRYQRDVVVPVFRHSAERVRGAIRRAGLTLRHERTLSFDDGRSLLSLYSGTKPA
ncbi:MAG TPA: class I SAM-dependent methyltransferase [Candidatus Elarobacter sp.]|nr:class I SAM-dependent methyltransferase [Candidatus Elarobacter sp.]